ncbi:solute carrier family 23 protein [Bifidobacterium longum]|uniref:solute carrier family 23 protein n=1 Tax=Bifidobacterium longum TaxID=216816 RepID=UPI001CBCA535|nr:solute carrier family 23 protein [Bifidobacterium longum]UAU38634.1 Adenine permease AdeP [Bifidobacterium longum subsp. longum]
MEKFFHLKENGTTVSTEILAGLTTFFAMAYIIVVNPQILSQTGMPWGGVFLATIIAAIIGTLVMGLFANVPYAQAAGIAAGGRTGLTSVVVAICFALSAFLAPVVSAVPSAATAGVLVIVGCMMAASLKEVKWDDIAEAIPAFFAAVFMAFSYSISYGIAGGFIMYCIVKTCKGKAKEVHPIIWTVAALFILDFVCMAIL